MVLRAAVRWMAPPGRLETDEERAIPSLPRFPQCLVKLNYTASTLQAQRCHLNSYNSDFQFRQLAEVNAPMYNMTQQKRNTALYCRPVFSSLPPTSSSLFISLSSHSSQQGIQAFTHFYSPLTAPGAKRRNVYPPVPINLSGPRDTDTLLSA